MSVATKQAGTSGGTSTTSTSSGDPVPGAAGAGDAGKVPPAGDAKGTTTAAADDKGKASGSVLGDEEAKADDGKGAKDGDAEAGKDADKTKDEAPLDIKLPDGLEVDPEVLKGFQGVAKELGLKSEGAQKIFDLYATATKAADAKVQTQIAEQQTGWLNELKSDKDFGGKNFDATQRDARRAVQKYAPELRQFFKDSGLGSHPGLVKAFARIGRATAREDSVDGSGGNATTQGSEEAALRARYPSMFKDKE